MEPIYRFPGITPFSEKDQAVFFGRDADIENLYHSVLLNQCTVISGKSGIGKTSLIYAGLKPRIEKKINDAPDEDRQFMILPVRIGVWTEKENPEENSSLIEKVRQHVVDANANASSNEFLGLLPQHLKTSLWYRIKQLQFQATSKPNRIFFLIFDQIEELFTYPFEQFKELLKEFKEIMTGNLPDAVREAIEDLEPAGDNRLSGAELKTAYSPIPLKLLFAIRSDKLNLLNRLREAVPTIYQNPIELRPLSREQARKAITEPTAKEGDFKSEPFQIEEDAVISICDFIEKQPSTDLDINFEEWRIEPFTLQIICQHIERNIVPSDQDKRITRAELGDPDDIIKNYYQDVLDKLQLDEPTKLCVRKLIEEEMIYEPDQRRLILYKEIVTQEFHIPDKLLAKLVDSKLLRELTAAASKSSYEISHDWLVIPILNAKKERMGLSDAQKFGGTILSLEEEVKKNPNDYSLFKRMGDYYYFLQDFSTAILKYSEAIRKKDNLGIKGGDLELYFNRADCYFKLKEYVLSNNDLEHVLDIEPDHLLANYYVAYNMQMTGNHDLAKKYYLKVIKLDPSYANAYFNLEILYEDMKEQDESYNYYKKTIELNPNDHEAYSRLGILCASMSANQEPERKAALVAEAVALFNRAILIRPDYEQAYLQLAIVYYLDLQQHENAIETLLKITAFNPSYFAAWRALGIIYRDLKQYGDASKSFYKWVALTPDSYEPYYNLGLLANDQEKYLDAVTFLDKCLNLDPVNINAYTEKAYAHRMLQQIDEATACYKKILEIDPKNEKAARNLETIDQYSESEKVLLETIKTNPNDVSALLELGILANNKRESRSAINYFSDILKIDPENKDAIIEMAYAWLQLEENDKAIACYQDLIRLDPQSQKAYRSLAKVYDALKKWDEAEAAFRKATELDPTDHESFYRWGIIANDRSEYEKAITLCDQALQIKPDHTGVLMEKAFALSTLNKNNDALVCYTNIIQLEPLNSKAYYGMGLIYEMLNDLPQATASLLKAIEINPAYYSALYRLGTITDQTKDYAKAIQYFEKCIELEPERSEAYVFIAYYYFKTRDFETSIRYYKKLLQLDPQNADAYYNLGLALKETGNLEESLISFKNMIKLKPDDQGALLLIDKINEELQQKTLS